MVSEDDGCRLRYTRTTTRPSATMPLPRIASRITANDGISRVPITILFARRVGELMCELSDNATSKASYRFYI